VFWKNDVATFFSSFSFVFLSFACANYDGPLVGLDVVFFTTTLYRGQLPTISTYPHQGTSGLKYKRVEVPLSQFNEFEMWKCNGIQSPQVRIILAPVAYRHLFSDHPTIVQLDKNNNTFLVYDGTTWYTNNVTSGTGPWVNFVVLDEVQLTNACIWGDVTRSNAGQGTPLSTEIIKEQKRDQWKALWWQKKKEEEEEEEEEEERKKEEESEVQIRHKMFG